MSKAKKDILRAWYAKNAKSNYEKSLLKSTYPNDEDIPKEKHVGIVLMTLQGQDFQCPFESAIYLLSQRFLNPLWAQVLKSSFLLHRALDQIGKNLAIKVAQMKNPMIKNFQDPSEKGMFHTDLVREYYQYLIQKSEYICNKLCIHFAKDKQTFFIKLENNQLAEQVDLIIKIQVQLLNTCKALEKAVKTFKFPITQGVATLIVRDTVINYGICQQAFSIVLDRFFQMQKDQAQQSLEAFKQFQALTKPMKNLQEMTRHIVSSQKFPKIKDYPPEILQNMEHYVLEETDPLSCMTAEDLELQRKMLQEFEKKKEEEDHSYKEQEMLDFVEEQPQKQQNQQYQQQQQQFQQEKQKPVTQSNDFDFFSESQSQPQQQQQGFGMDLNPQVQPQQQISKTDLILNQFNQPQQQPQSNNLGQFNTMQPGMMGTGFQNQQNFNTMNPQMMQMMQMFQTMQQMQGTNNPQYQQFMSNQMMGQNRPGMPMQFNTGAPNMGTGFQMQGNMGGMQQGMPGQQNLGMQPNAFGQQIQKSQPLQFQSQAPSSSQFQQNKTENKKSDNPFDSFF